MGKNYKLGVATIAASLLLIGCSAESLTDSLSGDDGEEFSRATLYLKDSSGAGVAGVSYNCGEGNVADGEPLITSGATTGAGGMAVSYWPGYDLICTITSVGAPALYLYDANGPINNAQVDCTSFHGFTGEDGVAGSINNASSDTCRLRLLQATIN